MAFCNKCGAQFEDGAKFCPLCGEPATPGDAPAGEPKANNAGATDYAAKISELNNTADTTDEFDKNDIESNKVMAILAYLSWLVIIPLVAAPQSKFARFHANQGLVLAITEIAYGILLGILSAILTAISWKLAFVGSILSIVYLAFFILSILGIVNAVNGRAKELPIIGKFKILK